MRPWRCVAALWIGSLLGCASPPITVLPSASDPAALRERAPEFEQIRVENGGHRGTVWDLAFAANGRHLYSGGDDKVVRVWDTRGGVLSRVLRIPIGPAEEGRIYALDVSADERWVAVGGCHGCTGFWQEPDAHLVFLLDASTGEIAGTGHGHRASILAVAFSPDGSELVSAGADAVPRVWSVDAEGRLSLRAELRGHGGAIQDIDWFPDGRRLVSAASDGLVVVWVPHPAGGWFPDVVLRGHTSSVAAVDVAPDGSRVVSGGMDGSLRLWSPIGGESIVAHQLSRAAILAVQFSPDGSRVAYGSGAGPWEETGVGIVPLTPEESRRFASARETAHAIAWNPSDGRIAATEGQLGSIALRTIDDLGVTVTLEGRGRPLFGVGFTSRGVAWTHERRPGVYTGALDTRSFVIESSVNPRAVRTGYTRPRFERVTLNDGGPGVLGIEGAPPLTNGLGKVIIEGSRSLRTLIVNSRLLVWSALGHGRIALGSEWAMHLLDLEGRARLDCHGHESLVNGVSPFVHEGIAISGSADQTVRFWDTETCLTLLAFHPSSSGEWAAWTPDGRYAVSGESELIGVHRNRGPRRSPSFGSPDPELKLSVRELSELLGTSEQIDVEDAVDAR